MLEPFAKLLTAHTVRKGGCTTSLHYYPAFTIHPNQQRNSKLTQLLRCKQLKYSVESTKMRPVTRIDVMRKRSIRSHLLQNPSTSFCDEISKFLILFKTTFLLELPKLFVNTATFLSCLCIAMTRYLVFDSHPMDRD